MSHKPQSLERASEALPSSPRENLNKHHILDNINIPELKKERKSTSILITLPNLSPGIIFMSFLVDGGHNDSSAGERQKCRCHHPE